MAHDEEPVRSRREILTAASAAAAVLVTGNLWRAESVSASDPNDVVLGGTNNSSTTTNIYQSTANIAGLYVSSEGKGPAIDGISPDGVGILGHSGLGLGVMGQSTTVAGVWGESGDGTEVVVTPSDTALTGVFGFAPASTDVNAVGSGVWGDSPDVGVYGTGSVGVRGDGGWGVFGSAFGSGGVGVYALAGGNDRFALVVNGKTRFTRSGRTKILKGKSSKAISLSGATGSSMIFAHLANNRSGRWVRAVVPASGKFTVYLNTALASDAYVQWFVLD